MMFNFLDIIFMAIILFIAIHGAVNGFINEFFGKAALVLGIFVSVMFFAKLAPPINRHVKSFFVSQISCFFAYFYFSVFDCPFDTAFCRRFFFRRNLNGA